LLVGPETERERWALVYRRAGFEVADPAMAPGSESVHDFVHASSCGGEDLADLSERLGAQRHPVGVSFRCRTGPGQIGSFIERCRDCARPVVLALPALHLESFRRLHHFVASGLVGQVAELTLLLPRGLPQLIEEILTEDDGGPALAGLAMISVLAGEPIRWQDGELSPAGGRDLTRPLSGTAGKLVVRVDRSDQPGGNAIEVVITGSQSTLALRMGQEGHEIRAARGGTQRVLNSYPPSDPMAETVNAVSRFLDGRDRGYADGHAGLRLAHNIHSVLEALEHPSPAADEPRPSLSADLELDVYQKLPLRWGASCPQRPFWEAKFNIETTCNQDCVFCFAKNGNMKVTNLSARPDLVTSLPARGIKGVMFSGGEPTLNRCLPDYIAQAKSVGVTQVTVESNALIFSNPAEVARCRDAGLDAAFVSFHSVRPATVELLTRTRDSLRKTSAGISNLLSAGIEVHLNCVTNAFNFTELPEIAAFVARELKSVSTLTFSFVAPLGRSFNRPDIVPRISQVRDHLSDALLACEQSGVAASVPGRCGIPLCFLPGLERFFVEYRLREHLKDPNRVLNDRVKLPSCSTCPLDPCCQGLWRNYADMYGTSELGAGTQNE